jgi:hypothetical protein
MATQTNCIILLVSFALLQERLLSYFPAPLDPLHVGRWVKGYFGPMSSVTATFMTHAVINDNSSVSSIVLLV